MPISHFMLCGITIYFNNGKLLLIGPINENQKAKNSRISLNKLERIQKEREIREAENMAETV